jgi:acylphosphatase
MAEQAAHILVSGIVQGVGYRYWTERTARELHLSGWVRNLEDGRVEILAEGTPEQLRELEARLWRGPRSAEVSSIEVNAVPARGTSSFEIHRTGATPESL